MSLEKTAGIYNHVAKGILEKKMKWRGHRVTENLFSKFGSKRSIGSENGHADGRTDGPDKPIMGFLFGYMQICKTHKKEPFLKTWCWGR